MSIERDRENMNKMQMAFNRELTLFKRMWAPRPLPSGAHETADFDLQLSLLLTHAHEMAQAPILATLGRAAAAGFTHALPVKPIDHGDIDQ